MRYFHGSPGFEDELDGLFQQIDKKYLNDNILIAYSYGAVRLIEYIKDNKIDTEDKVIILISPFLFPKKKSTLFNLLLKTPIISKLILSLVANKAIDTFLKDSSYPNAVPEEYGVLKEKFLDIAVLKKSLLEKQQIEESDLKYLKNAYVLYGDEDKTSIYDEQIKPLEAYTSRLISCQSAGHALPWTQKDFIIKNIVTLSEALIEDKIGYFKGEDKKNNIYSFLEQHYALSPDKEILKWVEKETLATWDFNLNTPLEHKSLDVKGLYKLSNSIAFELANLGISRGDRVILFLPMGVSLYATMFALQKIGAIPTFLDSWARKEQLSICASIVTPKAMITVEYIYTQFFKNSTEEDALSKIPLRIVAGPHTDSYDGEIETFMQSNASIETVAVAQEDTALITFTTGSSGTPKGADRTHRFLAAQHYALHRVLVYEEDDIDLPVFPIFSLNNLAEGITTVIPAFDVGAPSEKDGLILLAQIQHTQATTTTLSPSLLKKLSSYCLENKMTTPHIKRVVTGGAPISLDDMMNLKKVVPLSAILVLYGSTEVEPIAEIELQDIIQSQKKVLTDSEIVSVGVNVGHIDEALSYKIIKIIKEPIEINTASMWENYEVKKDEVGELIVSGEHVCLNYFNNKEAFVSSKIVDEKAQIWHRTGDVGRIGEDGFLWLVGRVHNTIIRKEAYFFPVQSEMVIKKDKNVEQSAYLGLKDEALGEKIIAVYSLQEGIENSLDIRKNIIRLLEKNNIIFDQLIYFQNIPMDARHHSKVEYKILRERLIENECI